MAYAVKSLRKLKSYFDFIVVRGTSGLLIGPELASRLDVPFGVVRKQTDNSHYGAGYEGCMLNGRYLIIDDFVASGETVQEIVTEVSIAIPQSKCVGVYCYLPKHSHMGRKIFCENQTVGIIGPHYKPEAMSNWLYVFNNNETYGEILTMKYAKKEFVK